MWRGALLGAVVATVGLAAAPSGLAASSSVSDRRGDLDTTGRTSPSPRYDIVSASHGHARGGRLVHKVTVAGDVADPASGDVPIIWIEHPTLPNGSSDCRYFIGRHEGRLGVFTCGYADRVASARIRRTGAHTVRYEFSPRAIDDPDSYDWAVVSRGPSDGTQAFLDRLPDGDKTLVTHRLR